MTEKREGEQTMYLRHLGVFAFIFLVAIFFVVNPSCADNADILAKQANKDLRQAEQFMFNGKNEAADLLLQKVASALETIRSEQPSHKSLRSLQSKYQRIRKQVDKKLGKGDKKKKPASPVVAPAKTEPVKKASSGSSQGYKKKMQERALKKLIKDIAYELDSARKEMADMAKGRPDEYIKRAEKHVENFKKKYPDIIQDSAIQEAVSGIDAVRKDVEQWRKMKEQKAQATVAAEAAAAAEKKALMDVYQKDAEQMAALYSQYYPPFESINGGALVGGNYDIKQIEKTILLLEQAEATIPSFSGELTRLTGTYGTTATDIYNTLHAKGYTLRNDEGLMMEQMLNAVENVKRSRQASAAVLAEHASDLMRATSKQLNDARIGHMQNAKSLLRAGLRFDPENKQIQDMLSKIDEQMAEVVEKMSAEIDAATWKDHISNFSGPGKTEELATAAMNYLKNDRDWGKKPEKGVEILAVSVRGQWKVAKRDPFGAVIQWRLPIHVAVTDTVLRKRGLARVYDLSILAAEGASNKAPKEPPYDGCWVGDSWMMRLSKF